MIGIGWSDQGINLKHVVYQHFPDISRGLVYDAKKHNRTDM